MIQSTSSRFSRRHALIAGSALAARVAVGQDVASDVAADQPAGATALTYDAPQIQNWRIGLILTTPVACQNVLATFPIPRDWPEQKVTVTGENVDRLVTAWKPRELPGGAKQIVLTMAQVPAGATVEMTLTFQVERSRILGPDTTEGLKAPKKRKRELIPYLGNSPHIDASSGRIKAASREIAALPYTSDWDRAEQIYDYVREKVEYVEGDLKNASQALKDGKGDCEEMTSLFIALCRNAKIPARMVWIPDHCYPEFYLEDEQGEGLWIPCQAAGTRQFGRMDEYRPVLQKGDRFTVPETKKPARYVSEYFTCDKRGRGNPRPKFIREMIDV